MSETDQYYQLIQSWWETKDVYSLCQYYFETHLTPGEEEIVRSVAFDENPRVVITCMTRYGKSWAVSMGVLLWILQNKDKKIALIAPTNEKTAIIRNYISGFISQSVIFSKLIDIEKTGIERIKKEVSRKRMTWKNGIEMRTLSAEGQGEQLMGFGAHKVIVDEECDIDYEVYRSKITRMLGEGDDACYVGIGNPWHRDNQFWAHWTDPTWKKIHIGWEQALKEGRISQAFVDEQRSVLTPMEFKVLYEAEFPESAADALIEWQWIDAATKKTIQIEKPEIIAGIDVAEQGMDLTVITIGHRNKDLGMYNVTAIESWSKTDLMPTVAKIIPILQQHNVQRVNVDATGVGSGVYSRLEELKREGRIACQVNAFKGGLSPEKEETAQRFLNMKAESYWHTRSIFEAGKISIPKHRELISQLSKMKWEKTSSEKTRIRDPGTKEGDTAEEKSPDFSDSLNIMLWGGSHARLTFASLDMKATGPQDKSWKISAVK